MPPAAADKEDQTVGSVGPAWWDGPIGENQPINAESYYSSAFLWDYSMDSSILLDGPENGIGQTRQHTKKKARSTVPGIALRRVQPINKYTVQ